MLLTRGRRARRVAMIASALALVTTGTAVAASSVGSIDKGKTVFFIPKDTLDPYEVIAGRGGKVALTEMGNKQVVQSGSKDTAAAQLPAVQTAIQTGASAIVIAGSDPAALCPQLEQAMARGVAVVTFDADTNCRQLFVKQADAETIGRSQIQTLAKAMGYKGEFAILSAASTAPHQNAWITYMKRELKLPKYKNMKLVKIYYGNQDPAESLRATESMLHAYPNLKGIESPTTVGVSSAAQYLSSSKYKGKVVLQGLGLPSQMKKYLLNDTLKGFALWNPENVGYLAAYAAAHIASGDIEGKVGESFEAGRLGTYKIIKGAGGPEVVLGPPFLFNKSNVSKFKF